MDSNFSQAPAGEKTGAERRWGMRIDVDLPVRLELADGSNTSGRMRNASISGAMIECALELPTFTSFRVLIPATGTDPHPIQIHARVVRAEHPRLGVEWRDVAPQPLVNLLHEARGEAT
jgi:hypothetical protein